MRRETREFPTEWVLSIITGRWFTDRREGIVFMLEFLLCRELRKDDLPAAVPIAAAIIGRQIDWAPEAADSFASFQGDPEKWLSQKVAEHGESQRLSVNRGPEKSEDKMPGDPMDFVRELTEEEGKQALIDEGNRCKLEWSDVNDINTAAVEAVAKVRMLAIGGDGSAIEMLRSLAVGITRHLHGSHFDSMRFAREFPVVLSAGNEARQVELEEFKALPVGARIGFPHRPGKKTGSALDNTPAGFWRDVQWWLEAIRSVSHISSSESDVIMGGEGGTLKATIDLQRQISTLPDFGEGDREAWSSAGLEFVHQNQDGMIPQWIWDRRTAGRGQRGLPSKVKEELRKGLDYCWPTK